MVIENQKILKIVEIKIENVRYCECLECVVYKFNFVAVININGNIMQIAGTTTQATSTATAATTTPVQPITSPTAATTQAGNIFMVITVKKRLFH